MTRNNIKIVIQILFSVWGLVYAQESSQSLFVASNADAVLYINTKQAEKEMDAGLWKMIQKDKNKAIDSKQGSFVFDMKNRDLGAKFEFHLDQIKPLAFHIKGSVDITGDIRKDIERLKVFMIAEDDLKIIESKQEEDRVLYFILPKEKKTLAPWELAFIMEGSKVFLLYFYNRQSIVENMQDNALNSGKLDFDFLQTPLFLEHSFVFWGNVKRLLPILQDIELSDKSVLEILKNLENVYVTGKVKGQLLMLHINAKTIETSVAAKYEEQLQPLASQFSSDGQSLSFISGFQIKSQNASLTISFSVNLQPIWSFLSKLPSNNSMDGSGDE